MLAPAKINLFLHITARRPNGYHELESLVVFARDPAACDSLSLAPADSLSLTIEGPQAAGLADEADNLVLRAARLLAETAGAGGGNGPETRHGAALTLLKRLPVASGIGGGSADAAAALRLLNAYWQCRLDDAALAALGLKLGADLPVCLLGRPAAMRGIGEVLEPLDGSLGALPPAWLVLANPGIALPTRDVFAALNGASGPAMPLTRRPASAADLAILLRQRRNDLEAPARFLAPLRAQSGCLLARLSGSGATCFGLFAEARLAEHAARALSRAQPAWWVAATAI